MLKNTAIRRVAVTAALSCLITGLAMAAPQGGSVTVYSSALPGAISPELYRPGGARGQSAAAQLPGFATVREHRRLRVEQDGGEVRFRDVAALIDPTTVRFRSLSDPEARVVEQDYQFDLVNQHKLLQRYIGETIEVEQAQGSHRTSVRGRLLSADGALVLEREDGSIEVLSNRSSIVFPQLPGGLITQPTLIWQLDTDQAGEHEVEVVYETGGITWWADYNLSLEEGADGADCRLSLDSWVSLLNRSGKGFVDTRLKLVAGDVQKARGGRLGDIRVMRSAVREEVAQQGFDERSFFEYHLYSLPRRIDMPDQSTKQIQLFPPVNHIGCEKRLVYSGQPAHVGSYHSAPLLEPGYGRDGDRKVDVWLQFNNDKSSGAGVPLPAGRVRVSKLDSADGSLELIGEDVIKHTPAGDTVKLRMGSAFDVVGERRQTDFRVDHARRRLEETIEIRLRNSKQYPVTVEVREALYRWANWDVLEASHEFDKLDARRIAFPVTVAADGETTVRYKVRYDW